MRHRLTSIAFLLAALALRHAAAADFAPGKVVQPPLPMGQSCTLYVPANYDPQRPVRYPIALVCTSARTPQLNAATWIAAHHIHQWADQRGVLVVSVNTPFAAQGAVDLVGATVITAHAEVLDPILQWIDTIPDAHPATRIIFSTDPDRGGQSWSAVVQARGAISGFIIGPGQTSLTLPVLPPRTDIAFLQWDRTLWDQTNPQTLLPVDLLIEQSGHWMVAERSRLGHALLDWPVAAMSMEQWQSAADWLIDANWLVGGPKINAAEHAAVRQRVSALLAAALAEKDPAVALPQLDYLMSLPEIRSFDRGGMAAVAWRNQELAAAHQQPTDFDRARALAALLFDHRFADTTQGAAAKGELATLEKTPAVVNEANAANALDAAVQLDAQGLLQGDPGLRRNAQRAYAKVLADYPGTEAAARAANVPMPAPATAPASQLQPPAHPHTTP